MGIGEKTVKGFPVGWNMAAKPCDSCKLAAALLFCRVHSAFLCMRCDSKVHSNKVFLRHERVWMCEVCEQAPASVTCKADAAALCVACDSDIHSANPLSRRHDRVPVVPFYDSAESVLKSNPAMNTATGNNADLNFLVPEEEAEATSWILPNPKLVDTTNLKNGEFFSDLDHLLDFDYPKQIDLNFNQQQQGSGSDSVVPVQNKQAIMNMNSLDICFDIDFCKSKLSAYTFPNSHSLSRNVSSPDVGVVPDGGAISDTTYAFGKQAGGMDSVGNSSASQSTLPLSGLDREARVMRYREKRKNRKFEKTIRYASRKAYAETRPRIKGRFAKRTETETDFDRIYDSGSLAFMADAGYSVVPTF